MQAQTPKSILLFSEKKTDYVISISASGSPYEKTAMEIIQHYFNSVSGISLQDGGGKFTIQLKEVGDRLSPESFTIKNKGNNILMEGNKKGLVYGAYSLVEEIFGCRNFAPGEKPYCPALLRLEIPLPLKIGEKPAFRFREVYSMAETDREYMDWHKLHNLEDLWGIWGHSFGRLVPESLFKTHPEYFAFYNGERHSTQLCLSNEDVFEISVKNLDEAFKENPDAKYWSVSPNDNSGFCECPLCSSSNLKDGGNQGSLLKFVNRIAKHFPDRTFTTLAYNATARPPLVTRPEKNVIIFLSNVEIARTFPVDKEASAKAFRRNLEGWSAKTHRIFIWDYYTQFTNFLAPFPNYFTFQPNFKYYQHKKAAGVFAQLNGPEYGDFAELKTYLLSKLLWNPTLDSDQLTEDFLIGYYGDAAPFVKSYMNKLYGFAVAAGTNLDIYGNPVNNYRDFLTPENLDELSIIMDRAHEAVETQAVFSKRIEKLRLSMDYTYLQQAKFYGTRKHGIFTKNGGNWEIRDGFADRVNRFVQQAELFGIKELSEGGISPKEYGEQWQMIFTTGVRDNLALNSEVQFEFPFAPEFPANGVKTLTDGTPGYSDFSFNWLCFYGKPMIATIDLGKMTEIKEVEINFLEDIRHRILRPQNVKLEYSLDGEKYTAAGLDQLSPPEEEYTVKKIKKLFKNLNFEARYLRVTAENQPALPEFIFSKNREPMLACDEIWVN
ncbi:DUF4838 domain-containing protein [Chryseobacterium sp.]|uniref:DUF4838 domain-containing protein n=1 Tax=Chryseobacterium sp. TaxID=1871047 RepID=UPI0016273175|nr:DUF4838 domain-containing protein [Chryseobacterium sp.]